MSPLMSGLVRSGKRTLALCAVLAICGAPMAMADGPRGGGGGRGGHGGGGGGGHGGGGYHGGGGGHRGGGGWGHGSSHGSSWRINIGIGGGYYGGSYYGYGARPYCPPVYCPPVYCPPPVVYCPPPVYYRPVTYYTAPVVVTRVVEAPVVYTTAAPAPVYVTTPAPRVIVQQAPTIVTSQAPVQTQYQPTPYKQTQTTSATAVAPVTTASGEPIMAGGVVPASLSTGSAAGIGSARASTMDVTPSDLTMSAYRGHEGAVILFVGGSNASSGYSSTLKVEDSSESAPVFQLRNTPSTLNPLTPSGQAKAKVPFTATSSLKVAATTSIVTVKVGEQVYQVPIVEVPVAKN